MFSKFVLRSVCRERRIIVYKLWEKSNYFGKIWESFKKIVGNIFIFSDNFSKNCMKLNYNFEGISKKKLWDFVEIFE